MVGQPCLLGSLDPSWPPKDIRNEALYASYSYQDRRWKVEETAAGRNGRAREAASSRELSIDQKRDLIHPFMFRVELLSAPPEGLELLGAWCKS